MAWGSEGHQVISLIAQSQLTPKARGEVDRLLKLEPGATLYSISTWADEHRNPSTAPWHYVNFPRETCVYEQARDCPDSKCVVGASERQSKILASAATDEERLAALKYLVHFVCSGQVISDSLISFFDVDSRSKALGDKLPSFECSRMLL